MSKVIKRAQGLPEEITTPSPEPLAIRRAPIIDRDVFEARSEAQVIRDKAQAEALQIHQTATTEALELKDKTYQEAQAQGYAEGKAQGAAELSEAVATVSARLQQIEDSLVPQIKDMVMAITRMRVTVTHFLARGHAYIHDLHFKMQCLAGERMIAVEHHDAVGDFHHREW